MLAFFLSFFVLFFLRGGRQGGKGTGGGKREGGGANTTPKQRIILGDSMSKWVELGAVFRLTSRDEVAHSLSVTSTQG